MNRFGCTPDGDVCMVHHRPLTCKHGCVFVAGHACKDQDKRLAEALRTLLDSGLIPSAERTNWKVIEAHEALAEIDKRT